MARAMPSKVASTASPAVRLLSLAPLATASIRSPFVICVHLPSWRVGKLIWFRPALQKQGEIIPNSVENVNSLIAIFHAFIKQAVTHAVIAHDRLLEMKKNHDPLNQGCARKNDIGPLGLQAVDRLTLCNCLASIKRHLAPNLAQSQA